MEVPADSRSPLQIQAEIIRVLDTFTATYSRAYSRATARKNNTTTIATSCWLEEGDVEWKALGRLASLFEVSAFTKADYVEDGIGAIHYGEIYTRYGVLQLM